jgi:peptide/nickel transport system permease protein
MLSFMVRRAIHTLPVLVGVSLVTFLLLQIIPGDLADVLLGPTSTEEARGELRTALGLDRPFYIQYLSYIEHLARGDLGQSTAFAQPVAQVLAGRLANTAVLALAAIALAATAGIAIGTWVALKPDSPRDIGLTVGVLFFNSMPPFWLGLILILIFGL